MSLPRHLQKLLTDSKVPTNSSRQHIEQCLKARALRQMDAYANIIIFHIENDTETTRKIVEDEQHVVRLYDLLSKAEAREGSLSVHDQQRALV